MGRQKYILLYPFSLIYGAITGIRNFLYNTGMLRSHEFSLPVICVGNITVGGTGKTPHCEYLIELLQQNFKVALLSRGYRRQSKGFLIALPEMRPADVGDEPLQICRKFPEITVAVDRNRKRGIQSVIKAIPETEVIIMDDGFQHRRIIPGLSILLTDFNRLMIKDHLLPYGELRESVDNMYRSDVILITKSPENLSPIQRRIIVKELNKAPYQDLYFTSFKYNNPVPLFGETQGAPVPFQDGNKEKTGIVLITGIASPDPLKDHISNLCNEMVHLSFPDHHRFSNTDLQKAGDALKSISSEHKFIITTEKDAVRIRDLADIEEQLKSLFWYIPLEVFFLNDDKNEFDNKIIEYVRKNKRNSRISERKRI